VKQTLSQRQNGWTNVLKNLERGRGKRKEAVKKTLIITESKMCFEPQISLKKISPQGYQFFSPTF
jgi:hypothetical protein